MIIEYYLYGILFNFVFVCVLFLISIVLLLLFLLLLPFFLLFLVYSLLNKTDYRSGIGYFDHKLYKSFCIKLESDVINESLNNKNLKIMHNLNDFCTYINGSLIRTTIHSIIVSDTTNKNKPNLLWIHGIGGTATLSLVCSGVLERLVSDFNVYAIDLPGFGRSTIEFVDNNLKNWDCSDIEYFFNDIIKKYIDSKHLKQIYLVSHSFGSFISVNFAHKYPQYVDKLLICNSAGMFPLLGKQGTFVSIIFKYGFPISVLRFLGLFGFFLLNTVSFIIKNKKMAFYWYYVQSSPLNFSDTFVSKFIYLSFYSSKWIEPGFLKLLNLKIPVSLCYSESDFIIPYHQGWILSLLSSGTIPLYIIADANHSPMHKNSGLEFSTVVKAFYNTSKHGANKNLLDKKYTLKDYYGYFSLYFTQLSTSKFYCELIESSFKQKKDINLPNVYKVTQNELKETDEYNDLLKKIKSMSWY